MATQTRHSDVDDLSAKDLFLKNPYLINQIFSHLRAEDDKEYRLCLFNSALTCKDLLEPALDALWEELDSLLPLLLPILKIEDEVYILNENAYQADWERLQYYSRKVKVFDAMSLDTSQVHHSTYFRIAQLHSSTLLPCLRHLRYSLDNNFIPPIFLFLSPSLESLELTDIAGFENILAGPFLATLPSRMLNRIVLCTGEMSVNTFTTSIAQFKHLRSLELLNSVFMDDFLIWEVLGTLPSLANLTLKAIGLESDSAYVPEDSVSKNEGSQRFEVLESLSITCSFLLIENLLNFIASPRLKSIEVYPVLKGFASRSRRKLVRTKYEGYITPFIGVVVSKWPQSLENFVIGVGGSKPVDIASRYTISSCLILLRNLHEIRTFTAKDWLMKNMDDDVRNLVMWWPKLTTLILPVDQMPVSLSTLRVIAENCPELHYLQIQLDISTVTSFNSSTSSESPRHHLKVLSVGSVSLYPSFPTTPGSTALECQIQVARHLDLMFPYLKSIETHPELNHVAWSEIHTLVKLCQDVRRVAK